MRISDWSSDVCSSDLQAVHARFGRTPRVLDACSIRYDNAAISVDALDDVDRAHHRSNDRRHLCIHEDIEIVSKSNVCLVNDEIECPGGYYMNPGTPGYDLKSGRA